MILGETKTCQYFWIKNKISQNILLNKYIFNNVGAIKLRITFFTLSDVDILPNKHAYR